jgi:hypothetical protein
VMSKLFIAVAMALAIQAGAAEPSDNCKAWLNWLADIARLEELRADIAKAIETAEGDEIYGLLDSDIEWRARILRLMQNPPVCQ